MKAMTLNELKDYVDYEIKQGNGDKKILIPMDDEGNGYNVMYCAITPITKEFADMFKKDPYLLPYGVNADEIEDFVILG